MGSGEVFLEEPVHDSPPQVLPGTTTVPLSRQPQNTSLPEKTLEIVGARLLRQQQALVSAEEALADCRYILLFFAQNNHGNTKTSVDLLRKFYGQVNN